MAASLAIVATLSCNDILGIEEAQLATAGGQAGDQGQSGTGGAIPFGGSGGTITLGGTGGTVPTGGFAGTTGGVPGTTAAECQAQALPDFNACDGCCMGIYPAGSSEWTQYADQCRCSTCATDCAGQCGTGLDTATCGDCVVDCAEAACIASSNCAPYLDCYKPCESQGGVTMLAAGERLAEANCAGQAACAPLDTEWFHGDAAHCLAVDLPLQLWEYELPGSGTNPTNISACSAAVEAMTCDRYWASHLGSLPECRIAGTRADGSACLMDSQCSSAYCRVSGYACGTCAQPPADGSLCSTGGDCYAAGGQWCVAGVCVRPGAVREPCGTSQPCDPGLYCAGARCVAWGTAGADCDPSAADATCDVSHGFFCDQNTSTCTAFSRAQPGGTCTSDGSYTFCALLSTCDWALSTSGTCQPGPQAGEACDDAAGPWCEYPELCTGGVCTPPPLPYTCG
jgi:hypothetical protein